MACDVRRDSEDSPHSLKRGDMGLWSRIRRTFQDDRANEDIHEELEFHLTMDAAQGHDQREVRFAWAT